jgi:hypothetical protein
VAEDVVPVVEDDGGGMIARPSSPDVSLWSFAGISEAMGRARAFPAFWLPLDALCAPSSAAAPAPLLGCATAAFAINLILDADAEASGNFPDMESEGRSIAFVEAAGPL